MASCTTVASRFWPLRSSGLHLMLLPRCAAPCWRTGVKDWTASWEKNRFPSLLWTALMERRVSSWSLRSVKNMPPRSLAWQWESTWASRYLQTTRWKLESKDRRHSLSVRPVFYCMMNKSWLKNYDCHLSTWNMCCLVIQSWRDGFLVGSA